MHRFYINSNQLEDDTIIIDGSDVNHIVNVLRLKKGEKIIACNGEGIEYTGSIEDYDKETVRVKVLDVNASFSELSVKTYLFQGLPKADKMDLIVQKSVELGVHKIIPVSFERSVVKLNDNKKKEKKIKRWQTIAESAASQSGRGIIPEVCDVLSFKEACAMAKELEGAIIPYELQGGMAESALALKESAHKTSLGIFIGPEGGISDNEIAYAKEQGIIPVSLGKRILRTETAPLTVLSIIMFLNESET